MNARNVPAFLATLLLLALPVADFVRTGHVQDSLLGGLLIVAFGGGGFAADKALKARVRNWLDQDKDTDA